LDELYDRLKAASDTRKLEYDRVKKRKEYYKSLLLRQRMEEEEEREMRCHQLEVEERMRNLNVNDMIVHKQ